MIDDADFIDLCKDILPARTRFFFLSSRADTLFRAHFTSNKNARFRLTTNGSFNRRFTRR